MTVFIELKKENRGEKILLNLSRTAYFQEDSSSSSYVCFDNETRPITVKESLEEIKKKISKAKG